MSYFGNIISAFRTITSGFRLTFRHFRKATHRRKNIDIRNQNYFNPEDEEGLFTIQYPYEGMPVPVNGRYKLHNEIDDCIVCDKCAKVCPVNCIEIVPIRSAETIGLTSDGTPKRIHAAKFDIDMAKCCFCGLCTTVCPTECLTMTDEYDFSVTDIAAHNFAFGQMKPSEIEEAEKNWEAAQAAKAQAKPATQSPAGAVPPGAKPVVPKKPGAAPAKPKIVAPKKPASAAPQPKVIVPKKPKPEQDDDQNEEKGGDS